MPEVKMPARVDGKRWNREFIKVNSWAPTRNELFAISDTAWEALSQTEVDQTVRDLKELDLYALPYPKIDVSISIDALITFCDEEGKPSNAPATIPGHGDIVNGKPFPKMGPAFYVLFEDLTLTNCGPVKYIILPVSSRNPAHFEKPDDDILASIGPVRDALIVLLATRNVIKDRQKNKLAALGIGKAKHRHVWTTLIKVPESLEPDPEHSTTGLRMRPHLRRGHIRNQHWGPNHQFIKKIWIEPVFVNADEGYVASRERYHVSTGRAE